MWIIDLNIEDETMEFLKRSIGENLYDFRVEILRRIPETNKQK